MTSIAFFGSSLLSSYWNGAATYYRGIIKALSKHGFDITFFEPDAYDRQAHRDIDPPDWAKVVVWQATPEGLSAAAQKAASADIVVKTSGVGYEDDHLLEQVMAAAGPDAIRIFWDVDAAATLAGMRSDPSDPLRRMLPRLDLVLTYGGGDPVVTAYRELGARDCIPVYNALDPDTHFAAMPDPRFAGDLGFLANRLPDRESRVHEFFFLPARQLPGQRFVLGGSGWHQAELPPNIRAVGHVGTGDHNAFNASTSAVLNVARDSMASMGFSPATRVFEAAGAAACIITDHWPGIELFLKPGEEVLVARDGQDVTAALSDLLPETLTLIGQRGQARILRDHTYDRRARQLTRILHSHLRHRLECVQNGEQA